MSLIDHAQLLSQLPVPCLYLARDKVIVYANIAADKAIHRRDGVEQLVGSSIDATTFPQIANASQLNEAIRGSEEIATEQIVSIDSNGSEQGQQRSSWSWTLSRATIQGEELFCLLAHKEQEPVSAGIEPTSEQEKLDLIKRIAGPSFERVDYYIAIVSEGLSCRLVNSSGRKSLKEVATAVQNMQLTSQAWKVWNEDFTVLLAIEDGAGPTAMRAGKSALSIMRGVEDHVTGERSIMDSSVTLIYHPFQNELLGCLVQIRPGLEWGEYLAQHDLKASAMSVADAQQGSMVRTMLRDGQLDYFSPCWERYTDRRRKELCSGSWLDSVHPDDLPILQQAVDTALSSNHRQEFEIRYREAASGTFRYFADCIAPLKDASGDVTRWYCISNNIHELVAQRRAASSANQRLYNIIDDMSITIFEMDANYNIKSAEGSLPIAMPNGVEQTAGGFVGVSFHDAVKAVKPGGIENFTKAVQDVMEGRSAKSMAEYEVGPLHMRTIMVPIKDDLASTSVASSAVKGLLGLTLDYSAQYNTEQAALRVRAMEHTARMKDEFLANISHELRTPIAGLLGLLDLLLETSLTAAQLDLTQSLQTSAMGLSRIVNDLLDFSKSEADAIKMEKVPFKLSSVLLDMQKSSEMLALNKGLQLEFKSTPCPTLVGDALRVRQILHNLISNAIKFTHAGFVRLHATHQLRADGSVGIEITIEDSGIGIDTETLSTLFRPFVQADESTTRFYGGTGLGLSIARKLARAMGGEVSLTSVKGKGTTGMVSLAFQTAASQSTPSLPLLVDEPPASGDKALAIRKRQQLLPAQLPSWTNVSVLVVEDNAVNQKVVAGHLKSLGIVRTSLAAHGGEAVTHMTAAMAQTDQSAGAVSQPDLIFMDCQMPVLDGFEATQQIRSKTQYNGPIIALTASATSGYREKCLGAGMNDYVTKPFTKKELFEVLQKWLPS